jgi:hypothetical protein
MVLPMEKFCCVTQQPHHPAPAMAAAQWVQALLYPVLEQAKQQLA